MISGINLMAVIVADLVGVLLLIGILLAKGWILPGRSKESHILLILIIATMVDCLVDPFVFAVDGIPGMFSRIAGMLGNSMLYLYNLVVGTGLLSLIVRHVNKKIPVVQYVTVWIITVVETLLLIINIFKPIVFSLDENNVYTRRPLYFVYIAAAFYLLVYCLVVYTNARRKDGSLRYFPVWEFILPIFCGVTFQTAFYGISVQPVSFAVAFCCVVLCLRNEYLYIDKLTGVYNRYELDMIVQYYTNRKQLKFTAIMLDLNDFKAINDNYSHKEGDEALIAMAGILSGVVGNDGNVIRFAGDEFVVIIDSGDESAVEEYCSRIRAEIDKFNSTADRPYRLSASMGGAVFDIEEGSDFLDRIDRLMYENKNEYYRDHDRRRD